MRKLFIILIFFIAVVTFIRAMDNFGNVKINDVPEVSGGNTEINIE
ncbi:MAG: hypothetical protein FWD78_00710 [Treponema sp.]|nr:hypothetical protein [Treponema sp.]